MAETIPNTPSDSLFDAYNTRNIVEEGHARAMEFQAILRELKPCIDTDEMDTLIAEATEELDKTTGHIGMDIIVTGNVLTRAIDPRGINIDDQDFDSDAVREASQYIEDTTLESMGYLIESQFDEITISHIAKGGLATLISTTKYGDLYSSNRIYIPIDGTAFVQPADTPEQSPQKALEYYADDLLQDIDMALLNTDNATNALRALGEVDLSSHTRLIDDNSIAQALNEYITTTLNIGGVTLYRLSGVDYIDIKLGEGQYGRAHISPTSALTGTIDGIIIDEETMRFCLHANMPFSDDTIRDVIYPLSENFVIDEHPVIRIS